jgi:hypothetical protein
LQFPEQLTMPQAFPPPDDDPSSSPSPVAKRLLALLWTVSILLSATDVGILSYLISRWQTQESDQVFLEQARDFQAHQNYEACWNEANKVLQNSSRFDQAQIIKEQCQNELAQFQIEQAKNLAANWQLKEALDLLKTINSPTHRQVIEQLRQDWSHQVLHIAETFYRDPAVDRLAEAIAVASVITPDCPSVYPLAQNKIAHWQQEWAKNANHFHASRAALTVDDLATAQAEIAQITVPFWQTQAQPLRQQISIRQEELNSNLWEQASQLLAEGQIEQVFSIASRLPDTAPWGDRKTQILKQAKAPQKRNTVLMQLGLTALGAFYLKILRG